MRRYVDSSGAQYTYPAPSRAAMYYMYTIITHILGGIIWKGGHFLLLMLGSLCPFPPACHFSLANVLSAARPRRGPAPEAGREGASPRLHSRLVHVYTLRPMAAYFKYVTAAPFNYVTAAPLQLRNCSGLAAWTA